MPDVEGWKKIIVDNRRYEEFSECAWCGIDIDEQCSDTTGDAEVLCLDCYAQYSNDRGLTDEGEPLETEEN